MTDTEQGPSKEDAEIVASLVAKLNGHTLDSVTMIWISSIATVLCPVSKGDKAIVEALADDFADKLIQTVNSVRLKCRPRWASAIKPPSHPRSRRNCTDDEARRNAPG